MVWLEKIPALWVRPVQAHPMWAWLPRVLWVFTSVNSRTTRQQTRQGEPQRGCALKKTPRQKRPFKTILWTFFKQDLYESCSKGNKYIERFRAIDCLLLELCFIIFTTLFLISGYFEIYSSFCCLSLRWCVNAFLRSGYVWHVQVSSYARIVQMPAFFRTTLFALFIFCTILSFKKDYVLIFYAF